MGSWNEILDEVRGHETAHDTIRRKYLRELSIHTNRNVVAYYSGWLQPKKGGAYAISDDDKNGLMACFRGLDRNKGLDLILHSPGGSVSATESLIDYIREMFGPNVRTIVPQISMSGGTMLACTGAQIVMGKHSNLGPIDPQFNGLPARELLTEFDEAKTQIGQNPNLAHVWAPILSKYEPTLLSAASHALKWSEEIAKNTLQHGMFTGDPDAEGKATSLAHFLLSDDHHVHDRHISRQQLREHGMLIDNLEDDQSFQDLVLSVHHAFMITFGGTFAVKIIENQQGTAMVKVVLEQKVNVVPEQPAPPSPKENIPKDRFPGFLQRLRQALRYVFLPLK